MRREISLSTARGPVTIDADVRGALAIHQEPSYDSDNMPYFPICAFWTVTHVATGYKIPYRGELFDERAARSFRQALLKIGDWGFDKPQDIPIALKKAAGALCKTWKYKARKQAA